MTITLTPTKLHGQLDFSENAPSKSILHREMICSYLAGQAIPSGTSDDTCATHDALTAFPGGGVIDVRDSASTLRFMIPLALTEGGREFMLGDSLAKRPLDEYACIKDAIITRNGNRVSVRGGIQSGEFTLRGDISSQFVTGLMFVLPLLSGDSIIRTERPLQSAGYVNLTIDVLKSYGIEITEKDGTYFIRGGQKYNKKPITAIEGDYSYAANFIVANALGADITLLGLNEDSHQPDRAIYNLLDKDEIDVSQCPDLFPILCVNACARARQTRIYNAGRLRFKESDRLHVMAQELSKLGADVTEGETSVIIHGTKKLRGGRVSSRGDHRIAMALTIAALCICDGTVELEGAQCVGKSAPQFWDDIKGLGARG